ncbi:MAG: glycerol-3-phosphate dehydrogenase C-terminal domain-containing protein, partial [Actinomycetota bacterium]
PFFDAALHARGEVEVDPIARAHLARMYGTDHHRVLDVVADDPSLGARISARPEIADIGAQVVVAVVDEGALTLTDIIDRRLALGTLGHVTATEVDRVAAIAGPLLGWSGEESAQRAAAEVDRRVAIERVWRARRAVS